MTAPLRAGEPIVVNVALGERSYAIVIGRGQLASLGEKIAALRPGAKAAIVSDEMVARHHLAATRGRACRCRNWHNLGDACRRARIRRVSPCSREFAKH